MNTASSSEDDDPLREARAYNRSIYFMVATPYLLFGAISFGVYRGYRKARRRALTALLPPAAELTENRDPG